MPSVIAEPEAEPSKHVGSARKGKAVEHLIAASCILASEGELNASTSLVDDEASTSYFTSGVRRGRCPFKSRAASTKKAVAAIFSRRVLSSATCVA